MMELSEEFIKLMQIGLMVVGLLSIFIIFINYKVTLLHNEQEREAYVLGDYLLSSKCLAVMDGNNALKSIFSETKLDSFSTSCIKFITGKIEIELIDSSKQWSFTLGTHTDQEATFVLAVKMDNSDGSTKPARMTVTV